MKHFRTSLSGKQFEPICATRLLQAAMMTLHNGAASDDAVANEHPASEEWLFVIAGQGTATIGEAGDRRSVRLRPGSLLVIERGEPHQIKQTGSKRLRTLNLYAPPAYKSNGTLRRQK